MVFEEFFPEGILLVCDFLGFEQFAGFFGLGSCSSLLVLVLEWLGSYEHLSWGHGANYVIPGRLARYSLGIEKLCCGLVDS